MTARALRVVLCDLDDTLFDHARATRAALAVLAVEEPALASWPLDELDRRHRTVLEQWHLEVLAGRATIEAARRARFKALLGAADPDVSDDRADRTAAAYRRHYEREWHTVPGAAPLLEALKSAGLRIAIVTNNVVAEQELKLRRCGLDGLVDALVASAAVGVQKPDPAIFDIALDRLGAAADEAVMIGDAWGTDIAGARAAGVRPVWLNRTGETSPDANVAELRSLEPVAKALAMILGGEVVKS